MKSKTQETVVKPANLAPPRVNWLMASYLLVAGSFGVIFFWLSTYWGIGVTVDPAIYLCVARNLLMGKGLTIGGQPLLQFPPLYPVTLAAAGWISRSDPSSAARWLHALLFVCNVTGATLLAYRLTEQSKLAAVSVSLLLLWSNVFFSQHIVALSEPLFFFWQLQICLALWRYFNSSQRRWLLLCGLCAGAGALTRYVGVILFPAIAFVVFLWPAQSCRKRLQAALWVVIPALLPPLALFLRNYLRDGQATSTTWAYHPIPGAKIWDGISAAGYFLLPLSVSAPVWLAVLVAMVGLLGFAYIACLRHYLRQTEAVMPSFKLQTFIVLWSLSYLVMLAVSLSLYNADTPLDHRILTPLYFVWVIAGISLARGYVRLSGRQGLWRVVLLWSLLLAGLNLRILTKAVAHYRCDGIGVAVGYTNRAWRSSGIISYLRALPAQTPIYSNAPDAIEFILGRDTKSFPKQIDPGNLQPVADYLQQEQQMKADVAARQGVIVYFDKFKFREAYLANIEEIKQRQNLRLLHLEDDGAIYIAP